MNIEQARFNMIEQQIRPWNIFDSSVLELLSVVRREEFVPIAYKKLAFFHRAIMKYHFRFIFSSKLFIIVYVNVQNCFGVKKSYFS